MLKLTLFYWLLIKLGELTVDMQRDSGEKEHHQPCEAKLRSSKTLLGGRWPYLDRLLARVPPSFGHLLKFHVQLIDVISEILDVKDEG